MSNSVNPILGVKVSGLGPCGGVQSEGVPVAESMGNSSERRVVFCSSALIPGMLSLKCCIQKSEDAT